MHDAVFSMSVLCLVIFLLIFLLKRVHQPYLTAYILAGILLGRHCLRVFADGSDIANLGSLGILLLMFFLGMELDIPDRKSLLLKPLIAQSIRTALSILLSLIIGHLFHLPIGMMLLLAILLAFNSTAVVSEVLRQKGDLHSDAGKVLLNMLLLQDIMLAPVLTFFQFTEKHAVDVPRFVLSVVACIVLCLLLSSIRNRNLFQLPVIRETDGDHELQVFFGACICLGFALIATVAGLGGPTGAFAAGLYIGRTNAFHWLESTLKPFKVFFTALFFVALGLMFDISFIKAHWREVLGVAGLILVMNSLISALVFRFLAFSWNTSLSAGALLSQTGEFSLIACTIAFKSGVINADVLKGAVAVIVLTLLLSTPWAVAFKKIIDLPVESALSKKTSIWP